MKKLTQLVLMLCLILSGALCYAGGVDGTGNEKGIENQNLINHEKNPVISSHFGCI